MRFGGTLNKRMSLDIWSSWTQRKSYSNSNMKQIPHFISYIVDFILLKFSRFEIINVDVYDVFLTVNHIIS